MISFKLGDRAGAGAVIAVGDLPALGLPGAGAHPREKKAILPSLGSRPPALSRRRRDRLDLGSPADRQMVHPVRRRVVQHADHVRLVCEPRDPPPARHGHLGRIAAGDDSPCRRSVSCRTACTGSCGVTPFFLSFVGGAILAPTPEVVSMILFTIPLLMLYEVGVAGAWLVERRNLRAARRGVAAIAVLLALAAPRSLHAQVPPAPPPITGSQGLQGRADTGLRGVTGRGVRSIDSSTAKRLGLPSGPTRVFPAPDSIMQALLAREGFAATRYVADSAAFDVTDQRILLNGRAATDRDDGHARGAFDSVRRRALRGHRRGRTADVPARARPPLIGIHDARSTPAATSARVIGQAYTSFNRARRQLVRSRQPGDRFERQAPLCARTPSSRRCDLPDPHYHFVAGQGEVGVAIGASSRARRCCTSATFRWRGCRSSSRTPSMAAAPAS